MMRVAIALLLASGPAFGTETDDVAAIRARRIAYNETIASRQAAAMTDFVTQGFVQLSSTGALVVGAEKVRDSYAMMEFSDPTFIAYYRKPDSITVSANGRFAVERGHWRGRFRDGRGGETGNTGMYQAGWIRQDGVWRVRTEHYVKLTCANPADCY